MNPRPLVTPGARERYEVRKALVQERVGSLVLPAMRRAGVDMWLVVDREPNTDPISPDLGGYAGDGNAYVLFDSGSQLDRVAIISHGFREDFLPSVYPNVIRYGYTADGLRTNLARVVRERDPQRIAIDTSSTFAAADGLSWSLRKAVEEAIGDPYCDRLVSAEPLILDLLTERTPAETDVYRQLVGWTVEIAERALSGEGVTLGQTTADDLHWWTRELMQASGLDATWAVPGFRIERDGHHLPVNDREHPIQPGDVINLDMGLKYLGMQTDLKRNAWVGRDAGDAVPDSLAHAFSEALAARDYLVSQALPGERGSDVWHRVIDWGNERGYKLGNPVVGGEIPETRDAEIGVYCHSVGSAVHDIGARICPDDPGWGVRSSFLLRRDCWYSVELHTTVPVREWDGLGVKVALEEQAVLGVNGMEYLSGTQDSWIVMVPAAR